MLVWLILAIVAALSLTHVAERGSIVSIALMAIIFGMMAAAEKIADAIEGKK